MTEDSPGKQQANYGYRIRQLERRPAPAASALQFCMLQSWNYDTNSEVATETWTDLCTGVVDGFYEQAYESADFAGTFDFDDGTITISDGFHAWAVAWVEISTFLNAGESLAVALKFGQGFRIVNSVVTGASAALTNERVMVAGPVGGTEIVGTDDVRIEVWHDHPTDVTIGNAHLQVTELGPLDAGLWQTYP